MMDYETMMTSSEELGAFFGAGSFVMGLIMLFLMAMNWMIFVKAGEAGWKSLIPFYNSYISYKIAWGKGWYFLLVFIPVIGFIFPIICAFKLAKAFGHGFAWGLGINLLPIIFYPMLAFGKSQYIGPAV